MKTALLSPADLQSLVRSSDLVARVVISGAERRLSADQTEIETDYRVSEVDTYQGQAATTGTTITVTNLMSA